MKFRQTKYVIALGFLAIGVAIVAATFLPDSMQYYVTVDELRGAERNFLGKELKVAGRVVSGSIQKSENMNWAFQVENAESILTVSYRGAMPDTFKEKAEVVVTGTLEQGGHIKASHVLAKCASRYEEKLEPQYWPPSATKEM